MPNTHTPPVETPVALPAHDADQRSITRTKRPSENDPEGASSQKSTKTLDIAPSFVEEHRNPPVFVFSDVSGRSKTKDAFSPLIDQHQKPFLFTFQETLKVYQFLNHTLEKFSNHGAYLLDVSFFEKMNQAQAKRQDPKNISRQLSEAAQIFKNNQKKPLFDDMIKRLDQEAFKKLQQINPRKTSEELKNIWASYNLGGLKRTRFSLALLEESRIPEWAEQHKTHSMNSKNQNRFDELKQWATQKIKKGYVTQNHSVLDDDLRHDFSPEYLKEYLLNAGYDLHHRKNKEPFSNFEAIHHQDILLSRRDLIGAFKKMTYTPYEIAQTEEMPLLFEPLFFSPSTKKSLLSADVNYFHAFKANLASQPEGEVAENSSPPRPRSTQKEGFIYLIDTRGLEVFPTLDNLLLTSNASSAVGSVASEVQIAMQGNKEGQDIPLNRLWLVNHDATEALNMAQMSIHCRNTLFDLHEKAQGEANLKDYDLLFHHAKEKKLTVLDMRPFTGKGPLKKLIAFDSPFYADAPLFENISATNTHHLSNWGSIPVKNTELDWAHTPQSQKNFLGQIILQVEDDYHSMMRLLS